MTYRHAYIYICKQTSEFCLALPVKHVYMRGPSPLVAVFKDKITIVTFKCHIILYSTFNIHIEQCRSVEGGNTTHL